MRKRLDFKILSKIKIVQSYSIVEPKSYFGLRQKTRVVEYSTYREFLLGRILIPHRV